ncbi:hypothetical protein EVAR_45035_1 [Eumeta japonica]|uniref:Uncharacterized protein n=1 Tax=Eumeta variegata TaxID=151549 RepID=A0A4C1YRI6_EUMVA|nr:hypothetical protein EVAR_45035_1 [Eumeta japonica]
MTLAKSRTGYPLRKQSGKRAHGARGALDNTSISEVVMCPEISRDLWVPSAGSPARARAAGTAADGQEFADELKKVLDFSNEKETANAISDDFQK